MTVYFISGLGADERVFQKIELPADWTIRHLKWLAPSRKESIRSYAEKMAALIDQNEKYSLVGLSFGGMLAVEISHILHPQITILISSISTRDQLPNAFKLAGRLRLNKLLPLFMLNKINPVLYWYFGIRTPEERRLLADIIHDSSPQFVKWAIGEIVIWKNNRKPDRLFHIHGTKDRVFPIGKVKPDAQVIGGGHFMVYAQADIISKILQSEIEAAIQKKK